MKFLSSLWNELLDFVFPKSNNVKTLESLSPGRLLEKLPKAENIKDENILLLFDYHDPIVRELVWQIKYAGNNKITKNLATVVHDVLVDELQERSLHGNIGEILLMPMPISDKRRNDRGWNQCELICEAVAELDDPKIFKYKPRQLVKHRHTESQTRTANRKERLENIKDSMRVLAPSVVKDKFIVLLDDVYTTGSTYTEARRALRLAGAKKILFIAIAH